MMSVSAAEESSEQSLPSFTTFSSELDPSSWDYYERSERDVISSQQANNYTRPWEMDPKDGRGFEPYPKLPSFQSQFQPFSDPSLVPEPSLAQPVPVPVSPNSASPIGGGQLTQLTQLTTTPLPSIHQMTTLPSTTFHTLTAVNSVPRSYPLVPAPIQARDIPTIQQQYLDERHIQIYQPLSTFSQQSVVTVLKNEPANFDISKNGLFQTPMLDCNGYVEKMKMTDSPAPTPVVRQKKERRKMRASSLESGTDDSAMDTGENHQVAAVSSTQANFKSPMMSMDDTGENGEKQTKKKRKRCGECVGCQKKDNCGDCAPCRNDKSHQICKQRRCEKLTEKKIIYGPDGTIIRGEGSGRGRGRGKGRGGGSGRGRKALNAQINSVVSPKAQQQAPPTSSSLSPAPATVVPHQSSSPALQQNQNQVTAGGNQQLNVSSTGNQLSQQQQHQIQTAVVQPVTTTTVVQHSNHQLQQQQQQQQQQQNHLQQTTIMKDQTQQPMTPMAFYPTWQDPSQGWQNQFIQQIPQNTPTITSLNSIEFQPQSYAYQPTSSYVQTAGLGFDPNYGRTYAAPVQRYEFQTNQLPLTNHQVQTVSFAPTVTYAGQVATGSALLLSNTQNGGDQSKQQSGNEMPGYPRVNNAPPRSLNCNGYPGSEYGGSSSNTSTTTTASMQPPQVPQSPSRIQPPRPASSNQMYQSVPNSPQSSHGSMTNLNSGAYSSPSHSNGNTFALDNQTQSPQSQQQDWNWNNGGMQQDMFNQSDRINLNTRLKTMILNKNDPAASEDAKLTDSTGHFLSYSHHLRGDNNTTTAATTDNNPCPPSDTFGRGGSEWKSQYPDFQQQHNMNSSNSSNSSSKKKSQQDFEQKQQSIEKNSEDISSKKDTTPYYRSETKPHDKSRSPKNKIKREYDHHTPYDYGDVRNVKQEAPTYKMEDYEKNYQSFIKYADYCDQQQTTQGKPTVTSDSLPYYPPYTYSGFQPYPTTYSQGYTSLTPNTVPSTYGSQHHHEGPVQQSNNSAFMATNATTATAAATNFEQQIPAHTYPKENSNGSTKDSIEAKKELEYEFHEEDKPPEKETKIKLEEKEEVKKDELPPIPATPKKSKVKKEKIIEEKTEKKPDPPKPTKKEKAERSIKPEIPSCECFKDEKSPAEPGSYYTHLGCAASLADLRKEIEMRCGVSGKQLRIEKVLYTGKEGKSSQGCPVAKWVIRRVDPEEKLLYIVKHRKGHKCNATYLVLSIVVWDGVPPHEADSVYRMLIHKLNKFGLPTTRRCATNENRTCACQGLDPETCGVSYSFGCSWSMYYNGCKYARSKTVRKFRLSVKSEEQEIEERMNILATILSPIYATVSPKSYENQTQHERDAYDCRLGLKQGKPFSGVTCCLDFCAHTHRDLHNMQDGCTVQAILLKPRPYGVPPDDEQLHVLPMYIMDTSDEFGDEEAQKKKGETGACKLLEKFPTEVRVRSTPLQPCRRHGKKRNNGKEVVEEPPEEIPPPTPVPTPAPAKKDSKKSKRSGGSKTPAPPASSPSPRAATPNTPNQNSNSSSAFSTPPTAQNPTTPTPKPNQPSNSLIDMASMIDNFTDAQLQSNQISSTVLDSPYAAYDYNLGSYVDTRTYYNQWPDYRGYNQNDPNRRTTEEIPDTTTRPGSNSSTSAFSPSIAEPKTPTSFTNLEDFKPSFHNERGFVKPKPPEYNYGYNYPHNTYPPYSPYEYNSYGGYNYGQSYHHQPYNLYSQTPPGPMPPPGPTSVPTPPNWSLYPPAPAPPAPIMKAPEPPKETLGEVTEVNDNLDCFEESQMGGVAIALQHGSLIIECAKLEMHSTTSLKVPNRLNPTRITLIFYQHRNLNRRAHGTAEWAEKMRLKKLGLATLEEEDELMHEDDIKDEPLDEFDEEHLVEHFGGGSGNKKSATHKSNKVVNSNRSNNSSNAHHTSPNCLTRTTTSWTTQFPMHPCVVTGPYVHDQSQGDPLALTGPPQPPP